MPFQSSKPTLAALTLLMAASAPTGASAITVEVAKKCDAATAKAFPPRVPGNPAAGSAAGSGADMRAYYSKCVADAEASKEAGRTDDANKPASAPK